MRNTYYMIGIERNKDPELSPKQRNTSWFVILDDRKHGRSGKFAVFYDVDTGDYLEPPEGFLDSQYETLREWYDANPADDPASQHFVNKSYDASVPLSPEQSVIVESELTDDDIPPMPDEDRDDEDDVPEVVEVVQTPEPTPAPEPVLVPAGGDMWDDEAPFAPIGLQYARHTIYAI